MSLALHLFYCIEGGLFLTLVPWSPLWEEIFFFRRFPELGAVAREGLARGVVSGVGIALLLQGGLDLVRTAHGLLRRRPPREDPT